MTVYQHVTISHHVTICHHLKCLSLHCSIAITVKTGSIRYIKHNILMILDTCNSDDWHNSIRSWRMVGEYKGTQLIPEYSYDTRGKYCLLYKKGGGNLKISKSCSSLLFYTLLVRHRFPLYEITVGVGLRAARTLLERFWTKSYDITYNLHMFLDIMEPKIKT